MKTEEALEIVRRSEVDQEIKCIFTTYRDLEENKEHSCLVDQYKHNANKDILKINVDQYHFTEHEKNLQSHQYCELLIKKTDRKKSISVKFFCKLDHIENGSIYVKPLNIKMV